MAKRKAAGSPSADVLVIFGISGDLGKVMTFHSLYRLEKRGLLNCSIVGVAADHWSVDDLRKHASEAIEAAGEDVDPEIFDRFAARLSYLPGDFTDDATLKRLATTLKGAANPVFYLEIPPFLFATVVKGLAEVGLTKTGRFVIEKPFGHDLAAAQQRRGRQVHHRDVRGRAHRNRQLDGVAEQRPIMQPLLDAPPTVHPYKPGTWGPAAADTLLADFGGWRSPWIAS